MPNGVRSRNNTRHSNRYRQQQQEPPDIVLAEVFDDRVIIQGEHVDVDEVTELRRQVLELKNSVIVEKKESLKLMKKSKKTLDEVFDKLKKELEIKDRLANSLCEYESVIQHLEDGDFIRFKNQTKGRRLSHERTLKNLDFVFIHDTEGNEIPFKDLHSVLQKLEDEKQCLKKLCENVMKKLSDKNPGKTLRIGKDTNGNVDVAIVFKCWTWKGVDYRIDVDNKQVFDMDGRQVGETIGQIPTLWDKWWEELD
tara:strand:+ start:388 stop:1146 length:759 start_codon:yes stop_codon:yes gene_type:complete